MRRLGALLAGCLVTPGAWAQEGPDAHGFSLAAQSGDLRAPLSSERPEAFSQGDLWFGGLVEYARAPLVQITTSERGSDPPKRVAVLDDVIAFNLSAGVAAHERLRFNVGMPIYGLTTGGEDRAVSGPAVGDLRLSALGVLIRPELTDDGGGLGVGLGAHLDLPTGDQRRYLGQAGVAGGVDASATYEWSRVSLDGSLGAQLNPAVETSNLAGADALHAALGVGVLLTEDVGVHLEGVLAPPLPKNEQAGTGMPGEGRLAVRWRSSPETFFTLGAAAGFTEGIGSAQYRVFLGGGFGLRKPPGPPDSDPLGTFTSADRCPIEAETVNGYMDDDGCPDQLGTFTIHVSFAGTERVGAALDITHPDGQVEHTTNDKPVAFQALPGTTWKIAARSDGCLRGEVTHTVSEGDNKIEVPLALDIDANVYVEVTDGSGRPVPDARVFWRSATPLCVPPGAYDLPDTGYVEHPIGHGTHTVLVSAPDYLPHEEEIDFDVGDRRRIAVSLEPKVVAPVAPTQVRIEQKRIVILDKVHFETGKAIIKPESYGLLDEVASVIATNPQAGRVEVAGHTDSVGSEIYNLELSQKRAESVRAYLVGQGVDPERLVAKGYGETVPIDTNRTESGRERNRRVEFNLIDQMDTEGEGGTP